MKTRLVRLAKLPLIVVYCTPVAALLAVLCVLMGLPSYVWTGDSCDPLRWIGDALLGNRFHEWLWKETE